MKVCKKCGEELSERWLHICGNHEIDIIQSDGSKEDQKKWFAKDIVQPFTKDKKINIDFIKAYGEQNHPSFKS